ncbi:TetR/AcrR family transcriptional regulator [Polynucleobacter sp. Tro8-14-1]|jgi:AcrR family transcriptional regulator|uniref:TetR/AcrR family transcriptional regulator n=1 Tax=Polynucleobacter sp. Tro8-14-1 TaxID=1758383 RepID=UPI001C0DDB37|nr:TetR/AcrR family transcriptional regulator [Polynucleobacter sp. Tro8-14-1]MBU3562656.1 TetR/AcrR family transcriptional regulator [Polynucleobacter sp. Tro8-14-1]
MASKQKVSKPLHKSNSPVARTGQGTTLKKRLLNATKEDLIKGREKILMAARACFAKQGFAGTSMKDIQLAADCSRGNLYHHFKAKEEIVQLITEQNLGRFSDRIETILKESDARDLSLLEIIEELVSFAEEITKGPGKGMAFHVWSLAMVDLDIRQTMQTYFERIRGALEQKIILLMKKGKLKGDKNTEQLSVALFGLVIPGFTVQSVFMDEKAIDSTQYSESLNLLFKSRP